MTGGWHREDIKAAVRKRGANLRSLARSNGLDPNTMSRALRQRFPSYHLVISRYLGVSLHELWPHWYCRSGLPIGKSRPDVTRRALTHDSVSA